MDHLEAARTCFTNGNNEGAQAAALIAIAERLEQPPLSAEATAVDPRGLTVDQWHVQREEELDELREVVQGADHTAAKYYRRMRDAQILVDQAEAQRDELRLDLLAAKDTIDQLTDELAEAKAARDRAETIAKTIDDDHD